MNRAGKGLSLKVYDTARSEPYALYLVDAAEEDPCLPGVIDTFNIFKKLL